MYYLLYRNCGNHYAICDDEGHVLSDTPNDHTYHPTIETACIKAKVRKPRKPFIFDTNIRWEGDTILWYYPLYTLENPHQNFPELFI